MSDGKVSVDRSRRSTAGLRADALFRRASVCLFLWLLWPVVCAHPVLAQEPAPEVPAPRNGVADPLAQPESSVSEPGPEADLTPEQKRARERESQFGISLPDEPMPAPTDVALRPSEPKPTWRLILNALFQLAFVVGVIYAAAWVVRRTRYGAALAPGGSRLRVVDTLRLGADRSLHVVEVEGRLLLIGSAPHTMSLITELDSLPSPGYDTFGAMSDGAARPREGESDGGEDFFDHLVHAERGFDIADLSEEAVQSSIADPDSRRRPDPLARAMDVLETIERRRQQGQRGGRGASGVYDRRGRLQ